MKDVEEANIHMWLLQSERLEVDAKNQHNCLEEGIQLKFKVPQNLPSHPNS